LKRARVAILVNPMSGRDVRRLAAYATNMTHEAKRDIVARVAAGAAACGATDLFIAREPFRIATAALELIRLDADVHVVTPKIRNTADDTEHTLRLFLEAGCDTIVSLGGDGTNRAIVRALGVDAARVRLIPLSSGTNNVFPLLIEPTFAGMVAALHARGAWNAALETRCKVLRVTGNDRHGRAISDVALVDVVLLRDDHVGNFLPFDAERLEQILLTRAEPDAIGMSPIGGFVQSVNAADDHGLLVTLGRNGTRFAAPLSPGLFRTVSVRNAHTVPLDHPVTLAGNGVLALDGDRDYDVDRGNAISVTVRRDGPWIPDVAAVMHWAAATGVLTGRARSQ
jgi:hypothetical protein